jgi:hypothetical protein
MNREMGKEPILAAVFAIDSVLAIETHVINWKYALQKSLLF